MDEGSGPALQGIRVVDMTQYVAGPTVTRLMAEQGADIIKIEQPPFGDPTREMGIVRDGRSGYYVQQNKGKRSVCLDIDDPRGRAVLDALIAGADVLVENYGPGVLARRGLDFEHLHPLHPRLIVATISGFGRTSAYADKVAFDLIAQAYSGVMSMTGERDGPPMPVGPPIADVVSGVHAVAGIALALFHRERVGVGQHVDISMVDSLFHAHDIHVQGPPLTGMKWRPRRSGTNSAMNAPMGVYRGPESWIVMHVMAAQWPRLCAAMERPDLVDDPRFRDLNTRQRNRNELNAVVEAWTSTRATDAELLATLEAHRVPCAPVLEPIDALDHPYFESRRAIRRIADPILGEVVVPGNPIRLSAQPDDLDLVAPLLGEHNRQVMAELGYDDALIDELAADGVLVSGDT